MVLKIDKGVPHPPPKNKWDWVDTMEVDDSVLGTLRDCEIIYTRLRLQGKKGVRQKEEGGVRIWRVT
tara:strand:- start:574 stop:774 length:201 start_codon:yes stop_codon:yes gene_type:complete